MSAVEIVAPARSPRNWRQTDPIRERVDTSWMDRANCLGVDTALFFPNNHESVYVTRAAKEVCRECSVRDLCLAYAIDNHIDEGIYGGLTERQRRAVRRSNRLAAS